MSDNAACGYGDDWDDRYDDGPEPPPEPCDVCGRRDGDDIQSCPCGCQRVFHPRCTATCFTCHWPLCDKAQVEVGEETYCQDCSFKAFTEMAAFDPNTPDPGAAERGEKARAGFHRSAA